MKTIDANVKLATEAKDLRKENLELKEAYNKEVEYRLYYQHLYNKYIAKYTKLEDEAKEAEKERRRVAWEHAAALNRVIRQRDRECNARVTMKTELDCQLKDANDRNADLA